MLHHFPPFQTSESNISKKASSITNSAWPVLGTTLVFRALKIHESSITRYGRDRGSSCNQTNWLQMTHKLRGHKPLFLWEQSPLLMARVQQPLAKVLAGLFQSHRSRIAYIAMYTTKKQQTQMPIPSFMPMSCMFWEGAIPETWSSFTLSILNRLKYFSRLEN